MTDTPEHLPAPGRSRAPAPAFPLSGVSQESLGLCPPTWQTQPAQWAHAPAKPWVRAQEESDGAFGFYET